MKKLVVLLLLSVVCFPNCKKKETGTVWCVYQGSDHGWEVVSCEKSQENCDTKLKQLRGSGHTAKSEQKTNCNDCQ